MRFLSKRENGRPSVSNAALFFSKSVENLSGNSFNRSSTRILIDLGTDFPKKNTYVRVISFVSPLGKILTTFIGRTLPASSFCASAYIDRSPVLFTRGGAPKESCNALADNNRAFSNLVIPSKNNH